VGERGTPGLDKRGGGSEKIENLRGVKRREEEFSDNRNGNSSETREGVPEKGGRSLKENQKT